MGLTFNILHLHLAPVLDAEHERLQDKGHHNVHHHLKCASKTNQETNHSKTVDTDCVLFQPDMICLGTRETVASLTWFTGSKISERFQSSSL